MQKREFEAGKAVKAMGRAIVVACLADGYCRAVSDTWPHEMPSLSRGKAEKMWVSDRVRHYRSIEVWDHLPLA